MNVRTVAATVAVSVVLTLGATGTAFALGVGSSGTSGATAGGAAAVGTAAAGTAKCSKASVRLTHLETKLHQVEQRTDTLTSRVATVTSKGHSDRAAKITQRIGRLNTDHSRIAGQIATIEQLCNLPAGGTAPSAG